MTAAQIGNLQVRMGIDTAQFSTGLAQAQGSLAKFASVLTKFGGIAVGALSLGAVAVSIRATVNHMDELGKVAQKIGIPVGELSKLEYAAKLADVSLDDLRSTVSKFSKGIAEVGAGGKNDAGKALTALGISAVDAQGKLRPTSDIMADVAEEFAAMKDGAGKTAIAMALFGKSGADMIPLLNGGRDAIAGAGAELEQFGGVVTKQAAAQAEQFNDNLTRIQAAGSGLSTLIASRLAPVMADVSSRFVDWVKNGGAAEVIWGAINWVLQESLKFLYETVAIWKTLTAYVYAAGEAFNALTSGDLTAAGDAIAKAGEDSAAAWADAEKQFADYKASLDAFSGAGAPGKGDFGVPPEKKDAPFLPPNNSKTKKELSEAAKALEKLRDAGQQVWEQTRTPIESYQLEVRRLNDLLKAGVIDNATYARAITQAQDAFSQAAPEASQMNEALESISATMFDGLTNGLIGLANGTMSVKDSFREMANSIVSDLQDIASELLKSGLQRLLLGALGGGSMGLSGFGGLYANGGTLGAGKWGIAGEAGPEIVHGPATITPMSRMGGQTSVSWSPSIVINGSADQRMISSVMAAEREKFKADLPKMIRDARKRGSI